MPYSYPLSRIIARIRNFVKWLLTPTIRYSNIFIFILSILLTYFLLTSPVLREVMALMGGFGYLGAFVAGAFYTTSFTVVPAASIIYLLGKSLNPLLLALVGGLGALVTDIIIYHWVRSSIEKINHFSLLRFKIFLFAARSGIVNKIRKSRIAPYIIPVISGLIIASPLPDELGIALMGAAKYERKKFMLLAFLLNFAGILLTATLGRVI